MKRNQSSTMDDGAKQFLSAQEAERYAQGAGWTLLTAETGPLMCVRDDMPGVQYVLRGPRLGRFYWQRDDGL